MKSLFTIIQIKVLVVLISLMGYSDSKAGGSAYLEWYNSFAADGGGFNIGMAICVSPDGRIYATGQSNSSSPGGSNIPVVSLSPDGSINWVYEFDSNSFDMAYTIITDEAGNIYVGGESDNMGFTIFSLYPNGTLRWEFGTDGMAAFDLIIAPDGHLYAGGWTSDGGGIVSLTTDGALRWIYEYDAPDGGFSQVTAIDADSNSNIYASGSADYKYLVFSVDSDGNFRWDEIHQGTASGIFMDNAANDIAVGSDDNVYATGKFDMAGADGRVFMTMSFTSDGNLRWQDIHAGSQQAGDIAWTITTGPDETVYVGGKGVESGVMDVWVVIKYGYDGTKHWTVFENPIYGINGLNSITTDEEGNIFATGWTASPKYGMLGLTPDGETLFAHVVDPGAHSGSGNGVAVGPDGMVYFVGFSAGSIGQSVLEVLAFHSSPKPAEIAVTPEQLSETLPSGQDSHQNISIQNNGGLSLDFDIVIEYNNKGGIKNNWLATNPTNGEVSTGETMTVQVIFDTDGLTLGMHYANLIINSNDSLNPTITIPVELEVLEAEYILTLLSDPENGGVLTGSGTYNEGALVDVTATPNDGFLFVKWEDANGVELSDSPDFQYNMPAYDHTLIAVFEFETNFPILITEGFSVYPNPACDWVSVNNNESIKSVTLINIIGKTVLQVEQVNQKSVQLNLNNLLPGMYLLQVQTGTGTVTKRLQITR